MAKQPNRGRQRAEGRGANAKPAASAGDGAPPSQVPRPDSNRYTKLIAAYERQVAELEMRAARLGQEAGELAERSNQELSVSRFWRETFEGSPVSYLVIDDQGYVREVNRAAAALLGVRPEQVAGAVLAQFVDPGDLGRYVQVLREAKRLRQQSAAEVSLRTRTGRRIPTQLLVKPVAEISSRPIGLFRVVMLDLTSLELAQAELTQTQQNYRKVVDSVEGIVWAADARTLQVLSVSGYAEKLLGYPIERWRDPDFWPNHVYVADRERILHRVARAVELRQSTTLEYRVWTADRRLLWLHDNLIVAENAAGFQLHGVAIDITARREAEDQLRQAQETLEVRVEDRTRELHHAVAELESFSYSLSHDMRAPLRSMQGYSQLLLNEYGDRLGEQGKTFLQRMITSAERLDSLVQDVLKYSSVVRAPVTLEAMNLEPIIDAVINEYPSLRAANVEIEIEKPLLPVCGHPAFLTQCFSNLLTNAVKFTRPGQKAHIRVRTELEKAPDPEPAEPGDLGLNGGVGTPKQPPEAKETQDNSGKPLKTERRPKAPGPASVRVWIEDNGIGIAPQDQKRIFGIFQRVHSPAEYEGTGIGLAIVQKAAERMGGRVGVESERGHGSRFWLRLPPA